MSSRAFYRWWKKACANLGIDGVDLYGGTRHSTATGLGKFFTRQKIKDFATQHRTNKAFERYFQNEYEPKLEIAETILRARKGEI